MKDAFLDTSSFGDGQGGDVTVTARDSVAISGGPTGEGITSFTVGRGDAGNKALHEFEHGARFDVGLHFHGLTAFQRSQP